MDAVYSRATTDEIAVTTKVTLPDSPGRLIVLQADPDNTENVLFSIGSRTPTSGHKLVPGASSTWPISNAEMVSLQSDDTAVSVRVSYTVLDC